MTSGSRVYSELSDFIDQQKNEYRTIAESVNKTKRKLNRLENDHKKALFSLAEHYLPTLSNKHLHDAIKNVEVHVEEIISDKNKRINHLKIQTEEAKNYIPDLEKRVSEVRIQLDTAQETKDELQNKVKDALTKDDEYQTLLVEHQTTHDHVSTLDSEIYKADSERYMKIVDFEDNKAFMYLLNRGFGGKNYDAGSIISFTDSLLAKSINFFENRERYEALNNNLESLSLMKKSASSIQTNLEKQLKEIEQDTERETGFVAQAMEVDGIASRYNELLQELHREKQSYKVQEHELNELANATGIFYQRALDYITSYFETIQPEKLLEKAKKTPDPEDDILAKYVIDTRVSINETREDLAKKVKHMDDKQSKIDELEDFSSEFRRNDYDGSKSEFDSGFDMNTLLLGYIVGRSSLSNIRSTVDSSQSFRRETYTSPSSDDSPSSYSSPSIFSTSGSIGGGSFSTRGGF